MTDQDAGPQFTADDLALVPDADDGASGETEHAGKEPPAADAGKAADGKNTQAKDPDAAAGKGKTIADGADAEATDAAKDEKAAKEHKSYWPEDWREKMAEFKSAGDPKLYKKELARLKDVSDPSGVFGRWRDAESMITSGNLVKIPGKDAKEDEIKSFQKAIGWADKPEEMLNDITLENGAVLGDADKPVLNGFLEAVHGATSAKDFVNKATNWYFSTREDQAAELDQRDDDFHRESIRALKDEWGPAFERNRITAMRAFREAEGGYDQNDLKDNPNAIANIVLHARNPYDQTLLGNNPAVLKWLAAISTAAYPRESVVEDSANSQSIEAELDKLEKLRDTDPKKYWSEPIQQRERELLDAQQRHQERQRA